MINRWWNSFKISFSMYSRIPMPKADWTKENMAHTMCFFPLIGAVIGGAMMLMYHLMLALEFHGSSLSKFFWTAIFVLLPFLITGGIHMDGFLDTMDAISSYQPKERRLEILKDPHTGAFAIISCGLYLVADFGIYSSVNEKSIKIIALGFVLSRALSGLSVLRFPQARKSGEGSVATFSKNAEEKVDQIFLLVYIILVGLFLVWLGGITGAAVLVTAFVIYGYYHHMALDKFGGITGDLAGYFLQLTELLMALVAVLCASL